MPTYEYRCMECQRRFEVFLSYSEYGKKEISCPFCESFQVTRRLSKVRIKKNAESRLEEMADPSKLAAMEDNPQVLGSMMRHMSDEIGEEMPPEFDEVVNRLEKGQSPDQIEKELPDLADASPDPSVDI
ncbi:MAG: hypothetical protein CL609_14765 [Anaerolineaceae bacterium]|nr:hypothetical protein [Anaerolineaceae bacterium]